MGKVQRLGVETIQSIHTHESKGIISVVGNNWEYVYKDSKRSLNKSINMYDLNNNLLYEDLTMNKIMDILEMNNHKTLRDKLRNTDDFVEYRGYKFKNNN